MKEEQKLRKVQTRVFGIVLGLLLVAAAAFFVWKTVQTPKSTSTSIVYQTVAVRRGNLSSTVSGSGSLAPKTRRDYSFSVSGTIAELNVKVGDHVTAGQVLAVLELDKQLILDVEIKKLALQTAQNNLSDLLSSSPQKIAQALLDRANAQAALADAQKNLRQKGVERCESKLANSYYAEYFKAQGFVYSWEAELNASDSKYGKDYILESLKSWKKTMNKAYINWTYCTGYTDQEITSSQADLILADVNLQQREAVYQKLQSNSGVDSVELEIAKKQVKQAELQLEQSQKSLENLTMKSTLDGVVTVLNGKKGDTIGTTTLITISDIDHPVIQINFDETIYGNLATGCSAAIIFDTLKDQRFTGTVTQVAPTLTLIRNVTYLQGIVALDNTALQTGTAPKMGMVATVDITCAKAENVLLVPTQSLRTSTGGIGYVFVLNQSGTPEKRQVEVGSKTTSFAEIRSGLTEGEQVISNPAGLK